MLLCLSFLLTALLLLLLLLHLLLLLLLPWRCADLSVHIQPLSQVHRVRPHPAPRGPTPPYCCGQQTAPGTAGGGGRSGQQRSSASGSHRTSRQHHHQHRAATSHQWPVQDAGRTIGRTAEPSPVWYGGSLLRSTARVQGEFQGSRS